MANRDKKNTQRHEDNREKFREYKEHKKKDKPWRKGQERVKDKRSFIDSDDVDQS
jgi:hypothetical protein